MYDLKLNNSGDLEISDTGDVMLTQSVRQAVEIRLRWLFGEWRFAPGGRGSRTSTALW